MPNRCVMGARWSGRDEQGGEQGGKFFLGGLIRLDACCPQEFFEERPGTAQSGSMNDDPLVSAAARLEAAAFAPPDLSVPLRRRRGQSQLIVRQTHDRRDQGIAPFTLPAPCAHAYNTLPLKFRPDFFKLYARIKNPAEASQELASGGGQQQSGVDGGGATDHVVPPPPREVRFERETNESVSSEVMVAMVLTKSPPACSIDPQTGKALPPPKPLITLPARQLQPSMKRLSLQLDSQAYYSCCKVDKVCPELELRHWVEILKRFSVEHGRFSGGGAFSGSKPGGEDGGEEGEVMKTNVRRISFEGRDLNAPVDDWERRKLSKKDFDQLLKNLFRRAKIAKKLKVRSRFDLTAGMEVLPKGVEALAKRLGAAGGAAPSNPNLESQLKNSLAALLGGASPPHGAGGAAAARPSSNAPKTAATKSSASTSRPDSMRRGFGADDTEPLDPRWMACAALVHPHIEIMDCSFTRVKRDSLNIVSLLRRLTWLILDSNDGLVGGDLVPLATIENLEKLEVSNCPRIRWASSF